MALSSHQLDALPRTSNEQGEALSPCINPVKPSPRLPWDVITTHLSRFIYPADLANVARASRGFHESLKCRLRTHEEYHRPYRNNGLWRALETIWQDPFFAHYLGALVFKERRHDSPSNAITPTDEEELSLEDSNGNRIDERSTVWHDTYTVAKWFSSSYATTFMERTGVSQSEWIQRIKAGDVVYGFALLITLLPSLRSIDFACQPVENAISQMVGSIAHVNMDLSQSTACSQLSSISAKASGGLPSLRPSELPRVLSMLALPSLRTMDVELWGCHHIDWNLALGVSNVTTFNVRGLLQPEALRSLMRHMPKLRTFSYDHMPFTCSANCIHRWSSTDFAFELVNSSYHLRLSSLAIDADVSGSERTYWPSDRPFPLHYLRNHFKHLTDLQLGFHLIALINDQLCWVLWMPASLERLTFNLIPSAWGTATHSVLTSVLCKLRPDIVLEHTPSLNTVTLKTNDTIIANMIFEAVLSFWACEPDHDVVDLVLQNKGKSIRF